MQFFQLKIQFHDSELIKVSSVSTFSPLWSTKPWYLRIPIIHPSNTQITIPPAYIRITDEELNLIHLFSTSQYIVFKHQNQTKLPLLEADETPISCWRIYKRENTTQKLIIPKWNNRKTDNLYMGTFIENTRISPLYK